MSIPSDLFMEPIGVKFSEKARPEEISKYPHRMRFSDEVLKLSKSNQMFSREPRVTTTKERTDDWTLWALKKVQTILKGRDFYIQRGR